MIRTIRNAGLALILSVAAVSADPVTIAALGDSLTQGYGLPRKQGFVPQLQAWLDAKGADAAVINAGVSGDTTAGGLRRVDWTLTPDVGALIVELGGNDLLRGIDPKVSRDNLEKILKAATSRDIPVLLVGLHAGSNYGADYRTAFNAMYPDLAARYGTLLYQDFFAALRARSTTTEELRTYFQRDGIHPNPQGVVHIVNAIGPTVLELIERADSPNG